MCMVVNGQRVSRLLTGHTHTHTHAAAAAGRQQRDAQASTFNYVDVVFLKGA